MIQLVSKPSYRKKKPRREIWNPWSLFITKNVPLFLPFLNTLLFKKNRIPSPSKYKDSSRGVIKEYHKESRKEFHISLIVESRDNQEYPFILLKVVISIEVRGGVRLLIGVWWGLDEGVGPRPHWVIVKSTWLILDDHALKHVIRMIMLMVWCFWILIPCWKC